jgi:hypothetical protein
MALMGSNLYLDKTLHAHKVIPPCCIQLLARGSARASVEKRAINGGNEVHLAVKGCNSAVQKALRIDLLPAEILFADISFTA